MCGELTFQPEGHIYRLNGEEIPGVSDVMRFATREVYGDAPKRLLRLASERGTEVHTACEALDKLGTVTVSRAIEGYVEAYLKFLTAERPEWIAIEEMVLSTEGSFAYAGRLDRVGKFPRLEKTCLVDIKTTKEIKYKLLEIQLPGYEEAWRATRADTNIDALYVLQLREDGTYAFEEVEGKANAWQSCKVLAQHFWTKKRHKKKESK